VLRVEAVDYFISTADGAAGGKQSAARQYSGKKSRKSHEKASPAFHFVLL